MLVRCRLLGDSEPRGLTHAGGRGHHACCGGLALPPWLEGRGRLGAQARLVRVLVSKGMLSAGGNNFMVELGGYTCGVDQNKGWVLVRYETYCTLLGIKSTSLQIEKDIKHLSSLNQRIPPCDGPCSTVLQAEVLAHGLQRASPPSRCHTP